MISGWESREPEVYDWVTNRYRWPSGEGRAVDCNAGREVCVTLSLLIDSRASIAPCWFT
jgi:hypothetical protein